jgi:lysophospholipase L1-like esterase
MRGAKYITIIVLLCALAYLSFKIYVNWKSTHEVNRTISSLRYQDMLASFNDNEIDTNSIVFLGNSLTEGFDLSQFNNPHTVNRGISGDFTAGLIARMDGIIKKYPKKIFIEIGINDLIEKISPEAMYSNYDTILKKINRISPRTRIYIHSLLPTLLNGSIITSAADVNKRVKEFNILLVKLSEKYNCTYIDTWSHFVMKDNSMNPDLTTDGIHLKSEGYKVWVGVIEKMVTNN